MIKLLETVDSKQVAPHGAAFGRGGGGGVGGAGCSGRKGHDLSTRVASNKARRRIDGSMNAPWCTGFVITIEGVEYKLPDLQARAKPSTRIVDTAVHVKRQFCSVGGLLSTKTLHRKFEAGVCVLEAKKTRIPSFRIGITHDDKLQIGFGADGAPLHPI